MVREGRGGGVLPAVSLSCSCTSGMDIYWKPWKKSPMHNICVTEFALPFHT